MIDKKKRYCSSCTSFNQCNKLSNENEDVERSQLDTVRRTIRVGLAGNPNSGKTTLFNAITGAHQKVGNYAGVTVDKKEGRRIYKGIEFILFDLPGTYSLTAYSIDEVIARDFILEEKPDVVVDVLDATSIERNLFLCVQFQELGIPVVGALNLIDEAEGAGINIDEEELSKIMGLPLVKTSGKKGIGLNLLLETVQQNIHQTITSSHVINYGNEIETEITALTSVLKRDDQFTNKYPVRWIATKLLEKDVNVHSKLRMHQQYDAVKLVADQCINRIELHFGQDSEIVMSEQRYGYVHGAVTQTVFKTGVHRYLLTRAVDDVLLNRLLGLPLFFGIMWGIFQLTFVIGKYPSKLLEIFFSWLSQTIIGIIPHGIIQSLLVDGVIGGVGGVLLFVPLIIILFACISFLEDTGYMARAAFLMDRFLHIFGLHGQSFLPMVIGFGCSVPAIMSARTLKNDRDRIITILITPFMSCGAKLPVYILLAGAFFPRNSGNVVMSIYCIGVLLALLSALLFRRTVLAGDATPFVMELPPYRMPTMRGIIWHVWDKTSGYLKKAGTVLLAASILIWVIVSFPKLPSNDAKYETLAQEYKSNQIDKKNIKKEIEGWMAGTIPIKSIEDNRQRDFADAAVRDISSGKATIDEKVSARIDYDVAAYIETIKASDGLVYSIAGRIGKLMEPVVKPLGFDWRIGISVVTGMAAKEAVVSTLGVLYKAGTDAHRKRLSLRQALHEDTTFNRLVAFVLMIITLVAPPCIAALATIRAEIGWRWLGFQIFYLMVLAWCLGFITYRIGLLSLFLRTQ